MIHRIVQFALKQRFVVLMFTLLIVVAGAVSFQRMPVDAYPDLSPPMVELITQWPGHAAEEVERLTTLPLELAMNGTPNLRVMRSISLYGLSDVILTFDEGTEPYFARQVVFQRIADAQLPSGVTPSMAPLFSPSGLVYRYVIDSPDRSPMELHTFEDWIIERAYRSVPGVADDSGFGGPTMQYHVLLDPGAPLQLSPVGRERFQRHSIEQRQHWRRLLHAGRAVLLRARPRPAEIHRRHRRSRCRQQQRRARACERRRHRGDRKRAAPRHFRLSGQNEEQRRRRRRRHPDAARRADAERAARRRAENRRNQSQRSAARRQSPPLLRSQRSRSRHHRHRRTQPAQRHDSRVPRAALFPRQLPRRRHRRTDNSSRVAVCLYFSARHRRSRQPALHRRHRLRHHHRRHDRDGRKHLSRTLRAPRHRLRPARSHLARRARRRSPHLLLRRGDHRRIFADLCAHRPIRKIVPSDGRHDVVRAARRAGVHADVRTGHRFVLVQAPRQRKNRITSTTGFAIATPAASSGASTIQKRL